MVLGLAGIVVLLGHFGNRFGGTDVMGSLVPFAGGLLACVGLAAMALIGWHRLRRKLSSWSPALPVAVTLGMTAMLLILVPRSDFTRAFGYYRTLVGGREEASRVTLAHQVYAAYRRLGIGQLQQMVVRSEAYAEDIEAAAQAYHLDPDLLKGLAAAESSFLPRTSSDGGNGLFQITQAPSKAIAEVDGRFVEADRNLANGRYNAFIGAATLDHYLKEMKQDLFLGLLAYNIGPANGGLRFIMEQYGATDFVTIQPYLLKLPRDYPIRVLSYALAFRMQRKEGKLLAYEEGDNAMTIQALGIPGFAN